jgi:putative Holliday junction resolvase
MLDDLLQGFVLLTDDEGVEEEYRVLRVAEVGGKHYALLQSTADHEEEPLILRIEGDVEEDTATLVGIDDDDEWDVVAEVFDTLLFDIDEN